MQGYREDLAYIHDAGFSDFSRDAAPGLLRILRRHKIPGGLVVDLGCGSGRWARELTGAGYQVLGVDQSAALLRLARRIAPQARFLRASLLRANLPQAFAVTSLGECLNYTFDQRAGAAALPGLFARIYRALSAGGLFLFDVATPARIPPDGPRRSWTEGPDWAVLVESRGEARRNILIRRIVCFRKVGGAFRRSEEVHRVKLYDAAGVLRMLAGAGFEAECLESYGRQPFPPGIAGFLARKR